MAYGFLVLALVAAHTPGRKTEVSIDPLEGDDELSRASLSQKGQAPVQKEQAPVRRASRRASYLLGTELGHPVPVRRQRSRRSSAQARPAVRLSVLGSPILGTSAQTKSDEEDLGPDLRPAWQKPGDPAVDEGEEMGAQQEAKIDPCAQVPERKKKWCYLRQTFDSDDRIAQMLLCTTVLTCIVFYFVHAKSTQLRLLTWGMLDAVFSIVSAICLLNTTRNCIYLVAKPQSIGYFLPNAISVILSTAIMNAVMLIANDTDNAPIRVRAVNGDWIEYGLRTVRCAALGPTFGRFLAFSQIGFWAAFQIETEGPNKGGPRMYHEWVPLWAYLANFGYLSGIHLLRQIYLGRDKILDDNELAFQASVNQFEFAGTGLMLSFLTMQEMRYQIGGAMPSAKGGGSSSVWAEGTNVDAKVGTLLVVAVLSKIAATLIDRSFPPKKSATASGHLGVSWPAWVYAYLTRAVFSMMNLLSGWLLHFAAVWYIDEHMFPEQNNSDTLVRFRFFVAFTVTILGLGVLGALAFAPGHVHNRSRIAGTQCPKEIISATISLSIAFSWRRFYGIAVDKLTIKYAPVVFSSDLERAQFLIEICVALPMVCLLMPMQLLYMSKMTLPPSAGKLIMDCSDLPLESESESDKESPAGQPAEQPAAPPDAPPAAPPDAPPQDGRER